MRREISAKTREFEQVGNRPVQARRVCGLRFPRCLPVLLSLSAEVLQCREAQSQVPFAVHFIRNAALSSHPSMKKCSAGAPALRTDPAPAGLQRLAPAPRFEVD